MVRAGQDPAEGSREVVERELRRDRAKQKTNIGGRTANNGSHPENKKARRKRQKTMI